MTSLHYAVGDVHGRDDLLGAMHERIAADRRLRHADQPAIIVHLGDYIDRGPDSLAAMDRLMRGVDGFEVICLKGNHEALMLACLETDEVQSWWTWVRNGGDRTLASLGLHPNSTGCNPGKLAGALGPERIAWLRALPLYHRAGGHVFVHAGIRPGRPIEAQREEDLLWIRGRFLDSKADHGFVVVHGHTPTREPELRPNRIGIDTGAYFSGRLTAIALGEPDSPRLVSVIGAPG